MSPSSASDTDETRAWQERISKAKKDARSELRSEQDWQHFRFHRNFDSNPENVVDNCRRIDANQVSLEEFQERFERPSLPVVIKNAQIKWSAVTEWLPDRLVERLGEQRFKVGEDDEEYSVKLSMRDYVRYMRSTTDDSPLYIFDSNYGDDKSKSVLKSDYEIHKYFSDDLFRYAKYSKRPPHQWFVMGPRLSGTGIHIDPLGTSAWNALVHGFKRWCLFPNEAPRELVQCPKTEGWRQSGEAIAWFRFAYPKTKQPTWPSQFKPIEILQKPGETVFVPCGWWHVVLNLTETVAVTQNFCSVVNFPIVWQRTVKGRPKLSQLWLKALREKRPEIAALTVGNEAGASAVGEQSAFRSDTSSGGSSSSSSSSSSEQDESSEASSNSDSSTSSVAVLHAGQGDVRVVTCNGGKHAEIEDEAHAEKSENDRQRNKRLHPPTSASTESESDKEHADMPQNNNKRRKMRA